MPSAEHIEKHFTAGETVRDIVIGMSDGLTVPFALAAGLSGVAASAVLVVTAGLAEIAAGSIAMGLGGYLAARTDSEHYESELRREWREVEEVPEREAEEVAIVFREYGLAEEHIAPVLDAMRARPEAWVDFMMRFELGLEKPEPGRALRSAMTIALSYIAGGLIPLAPYMLVPTLGEALHFSVAFTLTALLVFGAVKGRFTGLNVLKSGLQTAVTGGLAAAAAFYIAHLVGPAG